MKYTPLVWGVKDLNYKNYEKKIRKISTFKI